MKTLNIESNSIESTSFEDPEYSKQPCWYVDINKSEKKKDYKWKIGIKNTEQNEEFECKFSEISSNNHSIWDRIRDNAFAIELLQKFKMGGESAIRDWFKHGCP